MAKLSAYRQREVLRVERERETPGDDLCALLITALESNGATPRSRDILVVTSKIVSKAEGRFVDLATLEPRLTQIATAARGEVGVSLFHVESGVRLFSFPRSRST